MMKNPRSEEENIIKDIRNLLRLKKKKMTLKLKIWEIFLDRKKKIKGIKNTVIRNIKNLFEY